MLLSLGFSGLIYLFSLQTIPNGSSDPYMIDVGETQVALHVWGTLHATGYPLYTILGNLFTPLPSLLGVNPAAAAGLFSALWTLVALALFYALLHHQTQKPSVALVGVLVLAFTRSVWIHSVVAEVYSFSLAILMGLWGLALLPNFSFRRRVWLLALLGGLGVAHHRALAFAAPGIFWALLPALRLNRAHLPRLAVEGAFLFLLGFLPYVYLPLRATAQAEWVYSDDLNTWRGFWFHFWGKEADYLVARPDSLAGWLENLEGTLRILRQELTLIGLGVALVCLGVAHRRAPQRRFAQVTSLSGLGFFVFAVSYHQAVLPEAILMMALPALVVGVVLVLDWMPRRARWAGVFLTLLWGVLLIPHNRAFIHALTSDPTGLASIEAARNVPRSPLEQPVLMLSWGPRYFAASYSRLVTGENADLTIVDHTADFVALATAGKTFYTEPDTLYGYPLEWWAGRIGTVYLTSAGQNVVRLGTAPRLVANMQPENLVQYMQEGVWLAGYRLECSDTWLDLTLGWYAESQPQRDLSVKVHLTPTDSPLPLAQADRAAPVYGWRPTSSWLAGELLQDHYRLPNLPNGALIRVALYEQLPDGTFVDYGEKAILREECYNQQQ